MTTWSHTVLMENKTEVRQYTSNKVDDARLEKRTGVGYAKQIVGRAGTKSVFTNPGGSVAFCTKNALR